MTAAYMPPEHLKTRAVVLALRRGFGIVRNEKSIYLVSRDGILTLLLIAANPATAWREAFDALETAADSQQSGTQ